MNFADPVLEKIVRRWKWTRNNTILLFETAEKEGIFEYISKTDKKVAYEFQPVRYQFQCIVTTTDAYYRKLAHSEDERFGLLISDGSITMKHDIPDELIKSELNAQAHRIENLLKPFSDKEIEEHIKTILIISDHEHLHQGEMIVMFREAGTDLPDRFKKAWAL